MLNQVLGAGDGPGAAKKCDFDGHADNSGLVLRSDLTEKTFQSVGPTVSTGQMLAAALFQGFVQFAQQLLLMLA